MNELTVAPVIPAMSLEAINKIQRLEDITLEHPQVEIGTTHTIHSGVYTRTVMIPAGVLITGALIKIPTTLIVSGDVVVFIGEETIELSGYNVLTASAGRKQAFIAKTDTYLTMLFATEASTVDEAEREFTDDFEKLLSRSNGTNSTMITGD